MSDPIPTPTPELVRGTQIPIDLGEVKRAVYADDAIPVNLGSWSGWILPPELLPDELMTRLRHLTTKAEAGNSTPEEDVEMVRLMVDDYDGFVAAGGNSMLAMKAMQIHAERQVDGQGVTVGEGDASSGS